jgi:PAS domain S-box-containing protein
MEQCEQMGNWAVSRRWLLVAGLTLAYVVGFRLLFGHLGEATGAVGMLAPVLAGDLLGALAGAGWGLFMLPISLVLYGQASGMSAVGVIAGCLVSAGLGAMVGRLRDLTKQSRAEHEELGKVLARERAAAAVLEEREAQLLQAQELTRVGSWDLDVQTRRVTESHGLLQMLGLAPDASPPCMESILALVHPGDRERVSVAILEAIVTRGSFDEEFRAVHADGSIRYVLGRATVTLDAEGEAVKLVGAAQDVTEQHRLRDRMVAADRAASLGTLAAGVGHEINNPLAYVVANLAYLSEELKPLRQSNPGVDWVELEGALSEAQEGAERVRQIVLDLKAFSRSDATALGPVDLRGVLDFSLRMTQIQLRHHARLVECLGEVPLVNGDPGRLGQVLVNLLLNAAQAIPPGHPQENEICVTTYTAPDGSAVIEVRDTGTGIPQELRERIFDPFFTTKAVGEGTGMGLPICRGIVSGLGGTIAVESEPGQGSTFRVTLRPAAADPSGR